MADKNLSLKLIFLTTELTLSGPKVEIDVAQYSVNPIPCHLTLVCMKVWKLIHCLLWLLTTQVLISGQQHVNSVSSLLTQLPNYFATSPLCSVQKKFLGTGKISSLNVYLKITVHIISRQSSIQNSPSLEKESHDKLLQITSAMQLLQHEYLNLAKLKLISLG